MPDNGTPDNVTLGPGWLYGAPLGTAEPTVPADFEASPPSAWRALGYTEEGSAFTYTVNAEGIPVAEELEPIKYATVSRELAVGFQMAEGTRQNFALALNIGANEANDSTALEPPALGEEVSIMLLWLSADEYDPRLWLFRKVKQGGAVEVARRKAPQKTTFPVTFNVEKPTGAEPFIILPNSDGLI